MNFLNVAKNFVKTNSRTILIGTGCVALVGTVVTAVNAGRQLDDTREAYLESKVNELAQANEELKAQLEKKSGLVIKEDEETGNEYYDLNAVGNVKATWKLFAPTAIFGTAAVVCFGTVFHLDRKDIAKLGATCVGANKLLKHKDTVIEKMSEKLNEKQKNEVAAEVVKEETKNVTIPSTSIPEDESGKMKFMDSFTQDVKVLTREEVRIAERKSIQDAMNSGNDFTTLYDFLDNCGFKHPAITECFGWDAKTASTDELIFLYPGADNEGNPVMVIGYNWLKADESAIRGTYCVLNRSW